MADSSSGSTLGGDDVTESFAALFDQRAVGIFRYVTSRIGVDAAEDIVSETFLIALRERHRYDPARAGARVWLFGIATNLIHRQLRHGERERRAVAREAARGRAEVFEPYSAAVDRMDAETRVRSRLHRARRLIRENAPRSYDELTERIEAIP